MTDPTIPPNRAIVPRARVAGAAALLCVVLAGCSLLSNPPSPTPSPTPSSSAATSISTETATPTARPHLVKSVTLVAALGEPKEWTPAGLTWKGTQAATAGLGATSALVEPASSAEIAADVASAAGADGTVVVTVGPQSDAAVQIAAAAHPAAQFIEVDVVVPANSPANVHGLVFDQAEAGYLAGFVAASLATSTGIGMVGDAQTDTSTDNYAAGFRNGAAQAKPGLPVSVGYAGSPDLPDKGRNAAAALVKGGAGVVLAMPSLAGIGAMREACGRKAELVAVEVDAWQTLPDVQPCLIVSVIDRYDTAAGAAIAALDSGAGLGRMTVNDVADGGIALGDFHVDLPEGFQGKLDAVLGALKVGPPRPTPAPPTPAPSTLGVAAGRPARQSSSVR